MNDWVPAASVEALNDEIARTARRLKREMDWLHNECEVQRKAGQDYSTLWARSGGLFFAYRDLCAILGWQ